MADDAAAAPEAAADDAAAPAAAAPAEASAPPPPDDAAAPAAADPTSAAGRMAARSDELMPVPEIEFTETADVGQKVTTETPALLAAALNNYRIACGDARRRDDDNFCLRFLRSLKFDVERAAALADKYWEFHDEVRCLLLALPALGLLGCWRWRWRWRWRCHCRCCCLLLLPLSADHHGTARADVPRVGGAPDAALPGRAGTPRGLLNRLHPPDPVQRQGGAAGDHRPVAADLSSQLMSSDTIQ